MLSVFTRFAVLLWMGSLSLVAWAGAGDENQVVILGLELPAEDLNTAERFYVEGLGFELLQRDPGGEWILLRNQPALLLLRHTPPAADRNPQPYLNLRVGDLEAALGTARSAGAQVPDPKPQPNAIGSGIAIADPFGNPLNLMRIDGDSIEPDSPPLLFNIGIRVRDMEASEAFLDALGLTVMTRNYLPKTLVWDRNGGVSVVVHYHPEQPQGQPSQGVLLATVPRLQERIARLRGAGMQMEKQDAVGPLPAGWLIQSSAGTRVRLVGDAFPGR